MRSAPGRRSGTMLYTCRRPLSCRPSAKCTSCLLLLSFPHISGGYLHFHRVVGARDMVSTSRTINFSKKVAARRHVDFARRRTTYVWSFENDERCIGRGCQPGLG